MIVPFQLRRTLPDSTVVGCFRKFPNGYGRIERGRRKHVLFGERGKGHTSNRPRMNPVQGRVQGPALGFGVADFTPYSHARIRCSVADGHPLSISGKIQRPSGRLRWILQGIGALTDHFHGWHESIHKGQSSTTTTTTATATAAATAVISTAAGVTHFVVVLVLCGFVLFSLSRDEFQTGCQSIPNAVVATACRVGGTAMYVGEKVPWWCRMRTIIR